MADPALAHWLDRLMAAEVAPQLPVLPGPDLDEQRRSVRARLENPRLHDDLERLVGLMAPSVATRRQPPADGH